MSTNVFVYGTLTEERRLIHMLGHMPEFMEAELHDWERLPRNRLWIVRPRKGATVEKSRNGRLDFSAPDPLVLMNLTDREMRIFDEYEGIGHGSYERFNTQAVVGAHLTNKIDVVVYGAGDMALAALNMLYPVTE